MASEWFYQMMGKQVGPISSAELRDLTQRGTVKKDTPVRKAPDGAWVPAERVQGLFAVSNPTPPPMPVDGFALRPSSSATEDDLSGLTTTTKVVMGACGAVCMVLLGFLVWFIAFRDTWELHNAARVSAKLAEADRLQQTDFLTAYKTYDEVLKEAKPHKITDEQFGQKLANAEKSRMALYPKVQEKIRAEEAEKRRLAEEKAKREAEERDRIAAEKERKRAAEESQRKRIEEEKRIASTHRHSTKALQEARNALKAVKRIQASTEIEVTYSKYVDEVGTAWAEVSVFAESTTGKRCWVLSQLLKDAVNEYKKAIEPFGRKTRILDPSSEYGEKMNASNDVLIQLFWKNANWYIGGAEKALKEEEDQ